MSSRERKFSLCSFRQYVGHFRRRWLEPVLPLRRLRRSLPLYMRYVSDWSRYTDLSGSESRHFLDSSPCLFDWVEGTSFDSHYLYQSIWAFKRIQASAAPVHIDVGSWSIFVGMLTAITQVIFVDIRPLTVSVESFGAQAGSILALPFASSSIPSLSCLHVAEHIGLGRYGDPLDPAGTKKAARELTRVLAVDGNLYFSVPVGRHRLCFNAHRIHSPQQILDYFHNLELVQFSGVDDEGSYRQSMDPSKLADAEYACGLFHFAKRL